MSWEAQFETAFTTALRGHAPLAALLAPGPAIYRARPLAPSAYPLLTWAHRDTLDPRLTGDGKVCLALEISIWSTPGAAAAIRRALHALLDERARVRAGLPASPLDMADWVCRSLRYLGGAEEPTRSMAADAAQSEVVRRVTQWSLRLYRV